jgi:GT2 family glycosyltransferase
VESDTLKTLVIVINWNGDQDLIDCLDSLQAAKTDLSQGYDVLVLDNASTTGAIGRIEAKYPWVKCLKISQNRYWAGGNNAAVQWALERDYEWIVLSNSDIVVGESWYPALQETGRSDEIRAVGFKIFGEARRVPIEEFRDYNASFDPRDLVWHDDIHMSGCFLAVRAACFAALGGFDEVYKMYAEEHDFLSRVRLAGWRTVRCNAPIYHVSELASRKVPLLTSYFAIRNNIRVLIKLGPRRFWSPAKYAAKVLLYMIDSSRTVDLVDSCRRREKPTDSLLTNLNIWIRACLWNVANLPATLLAGHKDMKVARSVRATRSA